jgi:hypothetical protein
MLYLWWRMNDEGKRRVWRLYGWCVPSVLTIKLFIRLYFMRCRQVLWTDGVRQLSRDFDMVGQNGESC